MHNATPTHPQQQQQQLFRYNLLYWESTSHDGASASINIKVLQYTSFFCALELALTIINMRMASDFVSKCI